MSNGNGESPHITNPIKPSAFGMNFQWQDRIKRIELKNGEDVLKLAEVFASLLDQHNIEYIIKGE